jgi:hypothetical protein
MMKFVRLLFCMAVVGFWAARASAVTLFSDNFNIDSSGSWTKNAAPTANASTQQATFAYDYSVMGIPPAPGSADTLGLRLRANIPIVGGVEVTTRPAGVTSGLSVSPTGQNFGTNYMATFYAWTNFFGGPNATGLADNAGSEGGTNNVLFALGTSGTVPLVVVNTSPATNSTIDGVAFATTGDGGIVSDYRVYPKSGTIVPGTTAGVYAAAPTGSATANQNTDAFYTTLFPAVSAPAIQQTISTNEYGGDASNTQAGTTQAGSFGFAWHKVVLKKSNNIVTWDIDDTRIATFDASALTLGGNNIALGESDVNTTTARHPSLLFTVFDNLVVTDVAGGLSGDFNANGKVDAADYVTWRKNPAANGGDPAGYNTWRGNFGAGPGSGLGSTFAVPEPGSILFVICSLVCGAGRRRRFAA